MSALGSDAVLAAFILFCRVGGCLMIVPGFSSARVPVRIRLLIAIATTLALAPVLLDAIRAPLAGASPGRLLQLILGETLTGALIGLLGALFFLALQFAATAVSSYIGMSVLPGVPIEDAEPLPPLASLVTLAATALLFFTDQHWEVIRALVGSYSVIPAGEGFNVQLGLVQIADRLFDAFLIALRISSPFIVFAVIVNLVIGLMNRLVPQIPVYFISMPFVLLGGLLLLYLTVGESLHLFLGGFVRWLQVG